MGEVVDITRRAVSVTKRVSVQVSRYDQDTGGLIYLVEVLFPDDTWTSGKHSHDLAEAQEFARIEAEARGAILLPDSVWPSHSTRR